MSEHLNAEPYERTPSARPTLGGYRLRRMTTRVGTLTLRVPQARDGSFARRLVLVGAVRAVSASAEISAQ